MNSKRFDHHQKGFYEVFDENHSTKLSSAGLVYILLCLLNVVLSITGKILLSRFVKNPLLPTFSIEFTRKFTRPLWRKSMALTMALTVAREMRITMFLPPFLPASNASRFLGQKNGL